MVVSNKNLLLQGLFSGAMLVAGRVAEKNNSDTKSPFCVLPQKLTHIWKAKKIQPKDPSLKVSHKKIGGARLGQVRLRQMSSEWDSAEDASISSLTQGCYNTVDGSEIRHPPVEGKVVYPNIYNAEKHPRWCRISSINGMR